MFIESKFLKRVVRATACATVLLLSGLAQADSGRFNLHFDVGGLVAGPPIMGGGGFHVGADIVLRRPVALDLVVGAGGVTHDDGLLKTTVGTWFVVVAFGVRLRFLDDNRGNLLD